MEKMTLGLLITFFMGVIVVVSLLGPIAKETTSMTDKMTVSAEPNSFLAAIVDGNSTNTSYEIDVSNSYPADDWRISSCPMTGFSMTMINGTALAVTTDYLINLRTGTYTLEDSLLINNTLLRLSNTTNSTYTFCGEGYITESGGRAMASLILIFAAIALLAFAVWNVARNQFT